MFSCLNCGAPADAWSEFKGTTLRGKPMAYDLTLYYEFFYCSKCVMKPHKVSRLQVRAEIKKYDERVKQ